jgi:hypothetical protein
MIPIDEQIASQKHLLKNHSGNGYDIDAAILASLEELKRIREVQVPEEPERITVQIERRVKPKITVVEAHHYDTLRDLLRLEIESGLDKREQLTTAFISERDSLVERAEAAEAKLAAIEKMGREPSEGMVEAGYAATNQDDRYCVEDCDDAKGLFTAMFAKMMEELK